MDSGSDACDKLTAAKKNMQLAWSVCAQKIKDLREMMQLAEDCLQDELDKEEELQETDGEEKDLSPETEAIQAAWNEWWALRTEFVSAKKLHLQAARVFKG